MRFYEDGPILPNELLWAQDAGQVIFFCGSGVSRAYANLPDFAGLASAVLDKLGADDASEARQLYNFTQELQKQGRYRGIVSADLIFGKLARDFHAADINRAVAECLAPLGKPNLSAHRTILRLARLPGGDTRVITTNFDLLFEACDRKLRSSSRSTLPRLQYAGANWGIVHVHGQLKPDYSTSDDDGLVLTSAQFGDAYLAQGWARDFVRDVLDRHVAVFIGYSADDPPMRYLLEGLQQSGGLKHRAYAFLFGDDEEAIAQWREKGVRSLPYGDGASGNHAPLWRTLEAWGRRTADPVAWRKKVFAMGRKGPRNLKAHERGMIAHVVASDVGAGAFSREARPLPAEWLCVFDPGIRFARPDHSGGILGRGDIVDPLPLYCLDDDPPRPPREDDHKPVRIPTEAWNALAVGDEDRQGVDDQRMPWLRGHFAQTMPHLARRLDALADWIARTAGERACVWWAARQHSLHPDLLARVKHRLETRRDPPVDKAVMRAWRAIFEYHSRLANDDDRRYAFEAEIRTSGWNAYVVRRFTEVFAPRLEIGSYYRGPIPPNSRARLKRDALVQFSVKYPEDLAGIDVPDDQLANVLMGLRRNIELAVSLEQEYGHWLDLCAIEPPEPSDDDQEDDSFSRQYAISGYVLTFVGLFRRLVATDAKAALTEYRGWSGTDEIFSRLRIWAAGLLDLVSAGEFATLLLKLDIEGFWPFKGERDLLLGLRRRWAAIPKKKRDAIVVRIVEGRPIREGERKANHSRSSAHARLRRLLWLSKNGCDLGINVEEVVAQLRPLVPNWKDDWADSAADDHDGRSGFTKTDTSWSALASVPIGKVIETANAKKGRSDDFRTEYNPFRGLSREQPLRAIGALAREMKSGGFSTEYWSDFLEPSMRKTDSARFATLVAGRVCQMSGANLSSILHQAARWYSECGSQLRANQPHLFDRLWAKFVETIQQHRDASGSVLVRKAEAIDWGTEALNSPPGKLAELHMEDPCKKNLSKAQGLPSAWTARADELLGLPGDSRRYALTMFAFNLNYFFFVDPNWTEKTFLRVLAANTEDRADADAIWSGFMWSARIPAPGLYRRLKPHFIQMAANSVGRRRRHGEILSGMLLAGWGSLSDEGERFVSDEELRAILINADDEFRGQLLWNLEKWTKQRDPEDEVESPVEPEEATDASEEVKERKRWFDLLPVFLTEVWPKHAKVRSVRTSARLVDIALSQGDGFPKIAPLVSRIVTPVENEQIFIPQLRRSKNSLASRFPEPMLELIFAILPDNPARWPHGAAQALREIELADPSLLNDRRLVELKGRVGDG